MAALRLPDTDPLPPDAADGRHVRELFESSDVGLIEEVLSNSYADLRIDARGREGGLRRTRLTLDPHVQLDHHQWTLAFDVTAGAPLGSLAIGWLRAGRACYRSDGGERRYGPDDVFIAGPPGQPYTASSANADIEVAVLAPDLLSQVADTAPGRARPPVRLTGCEPVSAQAAQTWKAASAYARDAAVGSVDTPARSLLAGSTARLLAAVALTVFPSTAQADPTGADRRDAHPGTLRRAIAFIEEHAAEDIAPADVAAAACVSIRAVQLAFRRHLDTTPMAYLRRVRLEAARRDLLAADPGATTVTAVAYRWGFSSASRFAASYRHAYGVGPGRALRKD